MADYFHFAPRRRPAVLLSLVGVLLSIAMSACQAPRSQRLDSTEFKPPPGATRYALDPESSRIWLQLHADGALARLGHTHVIVAQQLRGTVWLHPQLERSALELVIPVNVLLVDDPHERAAAGGGFAEPIDAEARAGTREHMLGESQLDAAHYPSLTLRSLHIRAADAAAIAGAGAGAGAGRTAVIEFQVSLREHTAQLSVPVHWQLQGEQLRASGAVEFKQSDLGIEPYSALLGALRVADTVAARFEILAQRVH